MVERKSEIKVVKLGDDPFLLELMEPGMLYDGEEYNENTEVRLGASEGNVKDWAAYIATPIFPSYPIGYGRKLPRDCAERLFPEWAKEFTWRR